MRAMTNYADRERVERFLNERVELDPNGFEPSNTIADAYLSWLGASAGNTRDRDLLWKNLGAMGFERQIRRRGAGIRSRGFVGLRLRAGAVAEPQPDDPFADDEETEEPELDRDAQLASLEAFRKALDS